MGVLDRVVAVLTAFSPDRPSLSLADIQRMTGLPKTTAHRTLHGLTEHGFLEQDERGRYVVGLRVFEVGAAAPRAYQYRSQIAPHLERACFETGLDVMLAVLDAEEAVLVEHLVGNQRVPLAADIGDRLPLHASGVGHVMLAFGPRDLLDAVCSRPLPTYTPNTIGTPEALRAAIAKVRRRGVAIVTNGIVTGSVAISTPILGPNRHLIAALLLILPTSAADDVERFTAVAIATARRISRSLQAAEPHDRRVQRPRRTARR